MSLWDTHIYGEGGGFWSSSGVVRGRAGGSVLDAHLWNERPNARSERQTQRKHTRQRPWSYAFAFAVAGQVRTRQVD